LQTETVLKPNVTKSLLKGTLGLAILSLFLTISVSTLVNYFIFLAISYALIGAYMISKGSTAYTLGDDGVHIRRLWRKEVFIDYKDIQGLGVSEGMLARRFGCGTVYLELRKGRGTHRSLAGVGVYPLRDVHNPQAVSEELSERTGPFSTVP
jgi:uncharacterized membrane protein YdbT with pleckstrin-like domain